jgi:hypothetical protein
MLKKLIPTLAIVGSIFTGVQAAEGDKLLGFEFGVGYHLVDDSRYDGVSTNFGLVLPVGQKFDVVVYHEVGNYFGKQDGDKSNVDSTINELRFRVNVWESETQAVKLMLGIGYADMDFDDGTGEVSSVLADIGINYTVFKTKSGPVKGELAVNAVYRWLKFEETSTNLTDDADELGGFVIGMNAGLYF